MPNELVKRDDNSLTTGLNNLQQFTSMFAEVDKFVDVIANSKTYAPAFTTTSEDGTKTINRGDITGCVMLGIEIGLNPMTAVILGNKLNANSIFSVMRGKELGLNPIAAMETIHTFTDKKSGAAKTIAGVHALKSILLSKGIYHTEIESYVPYYSYYVITDFATMAKSKVDTDLVVDEYGNILDKFFLYSPAASTSEITAASNDNKLFIERYLQGYRTTIEMSRMYGKDEVRTKKLSYTTEQAQLAGFLPYYDDKGQAIGGKDNWISHPVVHLAKQCYITIARDMCDDLIHGMMAAHELASISDDPDEVQQAIVIDNN
jgi:hypothetical protein